MKIVIIAGGKGTRISSVADEIPKAMIPIKGKPVVEYQVELAKRYGFTEFIFIIGHLGEQIENYFGDGSKWDIKIIYFKEIQALGTAGALAYLTQYLEEDFFVFYGDTVMDIDLERMLNYHRLKKADATLLIHPNDHPYDSDIVEIDENGNVLKLYNKPRPKGFISRNLVNAALFIFSPKVLPNIEKGVKSHIEKDVLPKCINQGMNIYGYVSPEYIKDMGTPDRYYKVCDDVLSGKVAKLNWRNPRPAIFLDRDGVISREIDLLHSADKLELIEGAGEAIKYINEKGYLAIVVTNQPVIARNLCTFEELSHIHAKLETLLGEKHAYLNAIYFCPHHPDAGYPEERKEYKIKCNCRKPSPGMLLDAAKDWNINISKSIMIGDRKIDVQAGENAGVKTSVMIEQNKPYALLDVLKTLI
ncbi:D,D-heptose 1,7-bisphosphate phosphatase [uncultured Paludibacter sp.]|uniref:D,D-heptose 1,7-bisphosphate phosphatase n=1 Tax=uncultured Paludibacter sp. TaxID=497635 RepID=A0A653AFZ5_9BACT|nr:D,D-heptose 1,7-bisphosphate phosphatase [uncultured Paludibacter sp.]